MPRSSFRDLRKRRFIWRYFVIARPNRGQNWGTLTMQETYAYSVCGVIQTLWLVARAKGIGLGWVSILHPRKVKKILNVPKDWQFIAYLCLGYPEEEHTDPELVRHKWQDKIDNIDNFIINR